MTDCHSATITTDIIRVKKKVDIRVNVRDILNMKTHRKPEPALVRELQRRTDRKFGLTLTAQELGISPSQLHAVVNRTRGISPRIAEAMGYRRVFMFEKVS